MANNDPLKDYGDGKPNIETMVDALDFAADLSPDHTAIICDDDQINYRQYRHAVAVFADKLLALDCKGKRIVVLMGNSIEMSVAIYAIWAAGGVLVLLNPMYTANELGPLIADADPCAVICTEPLQDMVSTIAKTNGIDHVIPLGPGATMHTDWLAAEACALPEPRPKSTDVASLQYTGGTTGLPKGARHLHGSIVNMTRQIAWSWSEEPASNVWLDVAPQFHIWGLCMTALVPTYGRDTLVLIKQFRPDAVLHAIPRHKVTLFAGGPAPIFQAIMGHPEYKSTDFSTLRLVGGGGSPFAEETIKAWEAVTGCSIHQGFGMSEAAPLSLNPRHDENRLGTCGPPCPGTQIEVVDVETGTKVLAQGENGEFRVRGPQMMVEYWHRKEETAETMRGGWIHTGDIGHLDEKGYVVIVDRKKEMAIVNGYNVFPREVDDVLFAYPGVQEAAAVGTPSDKTGEILHAYVVAREGEALNEVDIIANCEQNLAAYKVPAKVFVIDALPRTPAAKIDKNELRRRSSAS
ncbi:MAG: AMP-binding protein [Alphaproteobacteria bacterium]|jgi:long-chain acyl-CoA synthetase|nr:AMP-binding protein [Alphaproteobacteria bacterium]